MTALISRILEVILSSLEVRHSSLEVRHSAMGELHIFHTGSGVISILLACSLDLTREYCICIKQLLYFVQTDRAWTKDSRKGIGTKFLTLLNTMF